MDILPILSDNCLECHGPDEGERKAGLRLDTRDGLYSETDHGPVVQPGEPGESEVIRRITHSDPEERMPPPEANKTLTGEEIELIRRWIEQGAEWQGHWAFIPPERPELPQVTRTDWVRNPIDYFIAARLEEEGLEPSQEADRRTLIRRVTFDLTGLPPTPEEVEAFVNDTSPNAYERVVDRLLASVRYGERMTLAWMDAARYGDSSVYHADGVRTMWPWRDWVIRAYNENKPFDEFTIEQLAGDLLPGSTVQQKVATGFNRNHGTTDEGGAIDEEYRVEYVVDRVKTTSRVWLGLTMECAQCHDHKYDPVSQKEYYQFYAYFNRSKDKGMQTRNGNAPPLVRLFSPEQRDQMNELESQAAQLKSKREENRPETEELNAWIEGERRLLDQEPPESGQWHRLGPFTAANADEAFNKDFGPEPKAESESESESETAVDLGKSYGDLKWESAEGWKDGEVVSLGLPENSAVYLYRVIRSPEERSVSVSLGSDDSIKAWLNGKQVLANNARRGAAADQEQVTLNLGKGENQFLMKIGNAGGGSGFYFRLGRSGLPEALLAILKTERSKWTDEQQTQLEKYYTENVWPEGLKLAKQIQSVEQQAKELRDAVPTCMILEDMEEPRKTYVLRRGHYASPIEGEVIQPGVPDCLPELPEDAPPNRLALARWLVDPDHPLTARVTLNRYWQMLFGKGLVETVADFGTRGNRPSHPGLLDWLARDFIDNGWDIKRTIKQLVMSATYRQSSKLTPELRAEDPANRLWARAPRYRLQGEFIRDNALAVSGLLNDKVGGPSTKPYQPEGVWNEVSLDGNLKYDPDSGEKIYRRGMYIYWKRSAPMPSMRAFDAPTREKCVIQRQRTNTPLQALVTLNDVQFVEAARVLARRILMEGGDDFSSRIHYAFLLTTARPADGLRADVMRELYENQRKRFRQAPGQAEALLSYGDHPREESLDAAEHAAWTMVASAILNLDEVLTKE